MAGGFRGELGGIFALCRLIERHGDAIEFDLLQAGRSLDDLGVTMSWRDLSVLVRRWQVTPGTQTCTAVQGVEHWSNLEVLVAELIDLTASANWQRAGRGNVPKPKPYPRPWVKPKSRQLGSDPIPASEFNDWWESKKAIEAA